MIRKIKLIGISILISQLLHSSYSCDDKDLSFASDLTEANGIDKESQSPRRHNPTPLIEERFHKQNEGMTLLEESAYDKVIVPLQRVTFNTFFAQVVVERKIAGRIYVNCTQNPSVFYIAHPYGMSLLFGETEDTKFNKALYDYLVNQGHIREKVEWLQVFPDSWSNKIEAMLGENLVKKASLMDLAATNDEIGKVVLNTRVNFAFDSKQYEQCISQLTHDGSYTIERVDEKIYSGESGGVIPKHFWNNSEHFLKDGIGFSLICDDRVASTAFSSYIIGKILEIGIETTSQFRGKGFAVKIASRLIDYCLEYGYMPVWSCRLENTASYKLAQKLGFVPEKYLPYYKLNL